MTVDSKILNVKPSKPKLHYIPDVVYSQVPTFESPNVSLCMDILMPQVNRLMPAVIFVTGGAFIASNRARFPQLRFCLAEAGFVVASINYRTLPNSHFPQPIEDVKSAIRFLKANARRFGVDANQIAVIGDSAGGYLTAFAAVTNGAKLFNVGDNLEQSSKIVAAVDLYGVLDPNSVIGGFIPSGLKISANPIDYITKNSAPMLLMHGTADRIVSPKQTEILFQALIDAGVEAELYLIPNADHADDYWVQDPVFELIIDWINWHVEK